MVMNTELKGNTLVLCDLLKNHPTMTVYLRATLPVPEVISPIV